jgi:putative transcription factor
VYDSLGGIMACDMCGANEKLYRARVEGTMLTVCVNCAKHGTIIEEIKQKKAPLPQVEEPEELIVSDYAKLIRDARGNEKQETFAKRINEKESLLKHWETGKAEPTLAQAKKLGKTLGIDLIETASNEYTPTKHTEGEALTIGDLLKGRK